MFAIEVQLLTGRYVATAHDDRERAEWPPHPARFFSALVAAHYEAGAAPHEREALLWLEQQPPPALDLDTAEPARRDVLDVFVPVNDITLAGDPERGVRQARLALAAARTESETTKLAKALEKEQLRLDEALRALGRTDESPSRSELDTAAALLPGSRTRQVRTFPVTIPPKPQFVFVWPEQPAASVSESLDRLSARVTRLGHSSSLVACRVLPVAPASPALVPTEHGRIVLRTVGPGQLDRLDREWARHQGIDSRTLPARPQRYGPPPSEARPPPPASVFSREWIVFQRTGGSRPLSSRGADIARALRAALIEQHGDGPLPEEISGHGPDGKPTGLPHIAFVALPNVGHEHGDASVQGCAVIAPRELSDSSRETLLRLVGKWEVNRAVSTESNTMELAAVGLPPIRVQRTEAPSKATLQESRWCRPSRRFATATPIALDRNPGNLRSNQERTAHRASVEAQRSVADACERIGLPRPISVKIAFEPFIRGAQSTRDFSPWPAQRSRTPRVRVHAELEFDQAVAGPVLLGAGRFFGMGLCLPIEEDR